MLYEFECTHCGAQFEARRAIEERNHADCPRCAKQANKRLSVIHNTFGFRLTDASHEKFHKDEVERAV